MNKTTLYVSPAGNDSNPGSQEKPLASLKGARDAVRKLIKDGLENDLRIEIAGGKYQLDETVVFGLEDSAPAGCTITYAAREGEEPIFTSGKKIGAWKKLENPPAELPEAARGEVWVAEVPQGDQWRFKTLFDGEKMLPRARSKGYITPKDRGRREDRWRDLTTLHYPEGMLRDWDNLEDIEILVRPSHVWIVNYLTLKSVDEENCVAETTNPATYSMLKLNNKLEIDNLWLENTLEVLDKPGEWVLNTRQGKLYYWPEGAEPGSEICAPTLHEFIRVEGKNVETVAGDVPVKGLAFEGLTLTCGERDIITQNDKGIQHDWEMYDKGNALLRFRGAEDCAVEDCSIRNSGGSGVRLDLYAQKIEINRNHVHDLGGTPILLCGYGPGVKDVNKGHLISENQIHHCSSLLQHSLGIFIWQSGDNKVLNNYLHDLPYDAIVLSGVRPRFFGITDPVKWTDSTAIPREIRENMPTIRWDEVGEPETAEEVIRFAHSRNNLVQDNEIHNVMEVLGDGNAIYYSCAGIDNNVKRNVIYNSPRTGCEIRYDDDQEYSTVEENVIFGSGIKLKHNNYIENNIIIGGGISIRPETQTGCRVERNIIYTRGKDTSFFRTNCSGYTMQQLLDLAHPDQDLFFSEDEEKGRKYLQMVKDSGHEENGNFGNPMFEDLAKCDLRLKKDSPGLAMGIKQIDIEKIGLPDDPAFERLRKIGLAGITTSTEAEGDITTLELDEID